MPATFDHDFAIWLTQHGSERAVAVNTLEFYHPAFGSIYVCDYGEQFTAKKNDGSEFTAEPLGFMLELSADNVTTEQRVVIRMDNANGLVASQLRALTDEDLLTPVVVTYRVYLDTKPGAPAIDPVVLFVLNINMTRLLVECDLSAEFLPNVTSGTRYTFERFPSLVYV